MLHSVLMVSKNKISDNIYEVTMRYSKALRCPFRIFTINQKMTHYSDDIMKNLLKQKKYSGILS